MKRGKIATVSRRQGNKTRNLGFESLEGRELLAVTLSGLQTVGNWNMAVADEVLSQTEIRFTVTTAPSQAGDNVSINWGDGTETFHGVLDVNGQATATHTFQAGSFTVTATADVNFATYTYQSSTMALGHLETSGGADALFITGDSRANRVNVAFASASTLKVTHTNPTEQKLVSTSIAGIYGSLLGGNDSVTLQSSVTVATFFSLGDGNDTFVGGAGVDTVFGDGGNDRISGSGGADVLFGGAGNDTIAGGDGNDLVDGGSGNDRLSGGNGEDMLFGGAGNDTLSGDNGNDLLEGDDGNDSLSGGNGNDLLYGSAGNDALSGGNGDDWLFGEGGRDVLRCGNGNDVGVGGADVDQVFGDAGNDILAGGYDFLLNLRRRDALDSILSAWAVSGQIPPELSDPNLTLWDDSAIDILTDRSGRNLFYADPTDRAMGRFSPTGDVKVTTTAPTSSDVAVINYTTTSGIVDPTGAAGKTTTLLGRFVDDMTHIINEQLLCRKTIDFGSRSRAFQVLNVPDEFWITQTQFFADYNQPMLEQAIARNDIILAATTPGSGGGYGAECDFLAAAGYLYDSATHRFIPTA